MMCWHCSVLKTIGAQENTAWKRLCAEVKAAKVYTVYSMMRTRLSVV